MDYLTMDENVCPVCGKVFYTALGRDWGYSYKGNNYCSYHCMRHIEVRHRMRMGWAETHYQRPLYDIGPKANAIAADMRALRHLVQAANHLTQAARQQKGAAQGALDDLVRRTDMQAGQLLARYNRPLQGLDSAQRDLVQDLFVQARPVWQVAADRHIDTDLLGVKLCMAYQAMAGGMDD